MILVFWHQNHIIELTLLFYRYYNLISSIVQAVAFHGKKIYFAIPPFIFLLCKRLHSLANYMRLRYESACISYALVIPLLIRNVNLILKGTDILCILHKFMLLFLWYQDCGSASHKTIRRYHSLGLLPKTSFSNILKYDSEKYRAVIQNMCNYPVFGEFSPVFQGKAIILLSVISFLFAYNCCADGYTGTGNQHSKP